MTTYNIGYPTDKRYMEYKYSFGWTVQDCSHCTNCKHLHGWRIKNQRFASICPSLDHYLFDSHACQGRMDIGFGLASGKLELTQKLAESLYQCTLCGACDVNCKTCAQEMEPGRVLLELREMCVREGFGLPQHKAFIESIEKNRNPFSEPHEKRFSWMPRNVQPTPKAEVAYFVGCTTAYRRREIARATVNTLKATGTKFAVLDSNEYCCGKPAQKKGYREVAKNMMEHNIKTVNKMGAKTLITNCPGCYMSFGVDADEISDVDKQFEVLHVSQYVDRLMNQGKLKFTKPLNMKITYHDPCELARLAQPWKPGDLALGNVQNYETPRKILTSIPGVELVEMDRIKEYAYCCGSEVGWAFSDFLMATSQRRLDEARATGAEAIVSWCPTCSNNFKHAAKGQIKVYDAAEIIQMAL